MSTEHAGSGERPSLTVSSRREGAVRFVQIAGSVQLAEAEELAAQLPALVDQDTPSLLVDLSLLEFISSLGLSAFVNAHRRARDLSGSVHLAGARPAIAQLFRITRVSELIPTHATLDEARAALRNAGAGRAS